MTENEQAVAINLSFDATGISFHSRPDTLAAFKATGSEIVYDEISEPFTKYDGEGLLPLKDALERFAMDDRSLSDNRTLPRNGVAARPGGTDSKASYTTTAEKVAYIGRYGLASWEALPSAPIFSSEVKTQEDFFKLSRAEKSRRLLIDADACNRLPHAGQERTPQKGRTYTAALKKHIKSRGVH